MIEKVKTFIRVVSRDGIGRIGIIVTNSTFFTLLFLEGLRILGLLTNTYIGLVTYMVLPALFILGLLLIPLGWWHKKRKSGYTTQELLNQNFDEEYKKGSPLGSNLVLTIAGLTLVNILFFGAISARMLHFMDQPVFCGTACHVMEPEWTTYQGSPHAKVKCVSCHVGEGVDALIDAKLNGLYQVISVMFDLYEQPIPTPVHQLRPARETCEKCHWPDKFYGGKLKTITHYKTDSLNTPLYTSLNIKIGAAESRVGAGIHWHISKDHEIVYQALDEKRKEMAWVEVRNKDGSVKRFENVKANNQLSEDEAESRTMDCVDCHNRATHIYETMEAAIDKRLAQGIIPTELPYIKKVAMAALSNHYVEKDQGTLDIQNYVSETYRRNYPNISESKFTQIDKAAQGIAEIYQRNIHPAMKVTWGSYPNHIGHQNSEGCFRCHNKNMQDAEGHEINNECTVCHSILAWDEEEPFAYIAEPDTTKANYQMHKYLKKEFKGSLK